MKNKFIFICLFCVMVFSAHAECESYLKIWGNEPSLKGEVDFSIASCKAWPLKSSLMIAVLPFLNENNNADVGEYDLQIIVFEENTGKIRAQTMQSIKIKYDAIRVSNIVVDADLYNLNRNQNAFGVRINYAGSSNINPFDTTNLNLYVVDGLRIRPVLNNFMIEQRTGDWDGVCAGVFKNISRSLKVEPTINEIFARLKITEQKTKTINKNLNAECNSKKYIEKNQVFYIEYQKGNYTFIP